MNDGGDVGHVDDAEVERAVQQLLTRDEARIVSVTALVMIVFGLLLTLGWFIFEWRVQHSLTGGDRVSSLTGTGPDDPDLVDRIVRVTSDGFVLALSLLVIGCGCGLRLLAGRLIAQRPQIEDLDRGDDAEPEVHEVTLEPEL